MKKPDFRDVSNCPEPLWCEGCEDDGIAPVVTICVVETTIGHFCVGLCVACSSSDNAPTLGRSDVIRRVLDHGAHVGMPRPTSHNADDRDDPWGDEPPW